MQLRMLANVHRVTTTNLLYSNVSAVQIQSVCYVLQAEIANHARLRLLPKTTLISADVLVEGFAAEQRVNSVTLTAVHAEGRQMETV
jgi:hypothetical protein